MTYDLAIIGGGPAGTAAAVYAARKRLRSIFITKDWLGQSYVSDKVENWVGTVAISGLDLSKSLESHAKAYAAGIIDFKEGEMCIGIKKQSSEASEGRQGARSKEQGESQKNDSALSSQIFTISTDKGSYEAKTVLITTGSRRRALDIPGAAQYENKGLTYCATCDGPLYSGQDVAVIGGGNAGFESAAQLLAYAKSVTLLSRSGYKADPGTVEKVLRNPHMKAIEHAVPKEVKGGKFVTSLVYTDTKTGTDSQLAVTGIFVEVGSMPNTGFAAEVAKIDGHGHIAVEARTQQAYAPDGQLSTGIWAAGDCTDGLYHQNNIAAGDAVKAVEDIYLYLHAK